MKDLKQTIEEKRRSLIKIKEIDIEGFCKIASKKKWEVKKNRAKKYLEEMYASFIDELECATIVTEKKLEKIKKETDIIQLMYRGHYIKMYVIKSFDLPSQYIVVLYPVSKL